VDKKTTSWVAYVTFIGWIVAYCAGDKEGAKFHLNQALVIWLGFLCVTVAGVILAFIPILGWMVTYAANIFLIVMFILGLISAINQEEKELPLIGQIKILK
jgi:uncharacterized membrane protein